MPRQNRWRQLGILTRRGFDNAIVEIVVSGAHHCNGFVGLREAGYVCAGSTAVLVVGVAARTVIGVDFFSCVGDDCRWCVSHARKNGWLTISPAACLVGHICYFGGSLSAPPRKDCVHNPERVLSHKRARMDAEECSRL